MKEFEIASIFNDLDRVEAVTVSDDGEIYSIISKQYTRIKMSKDQAIRFAEKGLSLNQMIEHLKK